jgi:hypothetical protein
MPELVVELLLLEQALNTSSEAGSSTAANETSSPFFIPVLSPGSRTVGLSSQPIERQKYLHLCIRNIQQEQTALRGWNQQPARKLPTGSVVTWPVWSPGLCGRGRLARGF